MKRLILTLACTLPALTFAAAHEGRGPGALLNHADTDGDNRISADEFLALERPGARMGGHRDDGRPMHHRGRGGPGHQAGGPGGLMRADTDGDGAITRDEVAAHQGEMAARHAQRMAEQRAAVAAQFDSADTDGDDTLTRDELRMAVFNHMDANDDGYLSTDELPRRGHGPRGKEPRGKHRDRSGGMD